MTYPSNLTDKQWELIEGIVYVGASAKINRRLLIDAIFYLMKAGCQWRQLPKDFPNWKTIYSFFHENSEKKYMGENYEYNSYEI